MINTVSWKDKEFISKETASLLLTGIDLPEDRNEYIALVNKRIQNADAEIGSCATCARCSDNVLKKSGETTTKCPIEEHYVLPRNGYCHLYKKA